MPKISEKKGKYGTRIDPLRPRGDRVKIRVYLPEGFVDRSYIDVDQMKRWREYYLKQGFKVRKI